MKKAQTPRKTLAPGVARVPKRLHYPLDVMLLCVRWYVAYSLSLRNLEEMMAERETPITIRQVKYLNNVVERDHRAIKRITRPMLGFKDFRCARIILSGIEVTHMIRKGQMKTENGIHPSAAEQFYSMVM
jgi:transposase-like protein